jgi:predicted DCC family thiol-disulfide oxidoreductase YuxK
VGADQGLTRLFYDGNCALCCGAVRFVARHDASANIRFAPLGGSTFARLVPELAGRRRPDSLLVLTPSGELLDRSWAVRHLLSRMGPGCRFLGACLGRLPVKVVDAAYDLAARHRPRQSACERPDLAKDARFEP